MSIASQELIQAWLFFPVLLVTASIFIGMAVFRVSNLETRNLQVLPTGFAALVVLGQLTTISPIVAKHTPVIFLVCTLLCAIYFGSELYSWFKVNNSSMVLGFLVFYIHGLPILMSGTPTFAGWIKLDDGASWLAITDQMLLAGRDTSILAPSTHEAISQILLNPALGDLPYPSGSFVPLGVFSKWLFIDPAWILQPYMAAAAMVLCITSIALLQPLKISNWSKRLAVVVAPTSAIFLGYEMWGGIKELLLVPLLVLVTALIPFILEKYDEPNRVIPFAIACSAYVLIFSLSGLVWLFGPVLLLLVRLSIQAKKIPWLHALVFIGTLGICSLASLIPLVKSPNGLFKLLSFAQSSSDIGNLLGPLKFTQIFGIWLTGDFRYSPEFPVINTALVILSGLLFVLGCYFLMTTGHSHIGALGIWVTLLSAFALKGNAWISGKTLAMASPIVLVIAFCAVGFLANRFTLEASVLAVALTSGVLVSYVYTYHEVWLAPYAQLKELEIIGQDTSYSAPALMIEYSPYGARHFLRNLDAESAGELRRNLIPLRNGTGLEKGAAAEIDEFSLDAIEKYQTLVLRTAPNSSRPPSNYALKFSGTYYEVWKKNPEAKLPIQHYPFGNSDTNSAIPDCDFIAKDISTNLPGNDALVSSEKRFIDLPIVNITNQVSEIGNKSVFESKFEVSDMGKYDLWVAGFTKGRSEIFIDGVHVAKVSHLLNNWGAITRIGNVQLTSGPHVLKFVTDSPWLIPGSGGLSYPMGPFYLSDQNEKHSVELVSPENLNSLCTKPVDWIELVPK